MLPLAVDVELFTLVEEVELELDDVEPDVDVEPVPLVVPDVEPDVVPVPVVVVALLIQQDLTTPTAGSLPKVPLSHMAPFVNVFVILFAVVLEP
jgi:hypothetical protein